MRDFSAPFSAWAGPRHPKMLIIGEAHGEHESVVGEPFCAAAGAELWRMLGEAAPDLFPEEHARVTRLIPYSFQEISPSSFDWVRERSSWLAAAGVAFTNVLNLHPPGNKLENISCKKADLPPDYPQYPAISRGLYLHPNLLHHCDRLRTEIFESNPNLIVAAGNTACWALLQSTNISSIRGNTTETTHYHWKVLPTYHPAGVLRQWSWRPIVVADLIKAFREAEFPEIRRPHRQLLISPTLPEWVQWCQQTLDNPPQWLACDTETTARMIDTIGFARSASDGAVCMVGPHRVKIGSRFELIYPLRDGTPRTSYWEPEEEPIFWYWVQQLLGSPIPKIFQNGLYDIQYLWRMGLQLNNCLEDTMLLHHSLYPEMQKGLGFLGSIYTDEASWKLFRKHKADTEKRDE